MDLWMDFNLNTEWGLDLLAQPNAPFGDLKENGRLFGDMDPAHKPGDAVQQLVNPPSPEENIDIDWMESGDLGSFLDALDNGQDKLTVLEDSLFGCSQEIDLKDSISQAKSLPTFVNSDEVEGFIEGLTPPDSPEQVSPVIKIYSELNGNVISDLSGNVFMSSSEVESSSELSQEEHQTPFVLEEQGTNVEILDTQEIYGLSFISVPETEQEFVEDDRPTFSLSSPDNSSGFDMSSPEASPRPSVESMIQSSPELYKVIATPAISVRFSPYSKNKGEQKGKSESKGVKSRKGKESIELFPEELLSPHLSKKERKKIQNKNAAIRYRQKKKMEVLHIVDEVQDLEDKNTDLKTKVDDLQREIRYMKNLMEEIYKAKGLIK